MTELFELNNSVIRQRWPEIADSLIKQNITNFDAQLVSAAQQTISVDGVQLSSRYDRLAEANLIISQIATSTKQVTVYGLGMGDVPSVLIDNEELESISVVPLNLALLSLLLSYTDQTEWLSHPKVQLLTIKDQQAIATNYLAITPDLQLASDENAVIRDLLVYENNREFANKKHQTTVPEFEKRIESNLKALNRDADVVELKKVFKQKEVFVIATGPTLEEHYSFLRKQRQKPEDKRPLIIAVDTALSPLLTNDIVPDILVTIDKVITKKHLHEPIPESITLVYFPSTSNTLIESWKGNKYNAYSSSVNYDELNQKIPKTRLFTNGSVIHPAIDLAVHLGCQQISLFGCDFSYPGNKTHAQWDDGHLGPAANTATHWVFNGLGNKNPTHLGFRSYLRSLEIFIRNNKKTVKFYQTSLNSAAILGTTFKGHEEYAHE